MQAGSWRNGAVAHHRPADGAQQVQRLLGRAASRVRARRSSAPTTAAASRGPDEIICGAPGSSNPSCSATSAPETGTYLDPYGQRVQQATWTSPVTNKLLLEAGVGTYLSRWGGSEMPGNPTRDLVRVTEQCTAPAARPTATSRTCTYRSENWAANWQGTHSWRASASYVTGANSMKFGYQGGYPGGERQELAPTTSNLAYRFNNGVPNQFTETDQAPSSRSSACDTTRSTRRISGRAAASRCRAPSGTTVRGAGSPQSTVGRRAFLPQRPFAYPETQGGVDSYNDITPRVRRGLRRVRHRQDVDQGQRRPVPAGGAEWPDLRRRCGRSTRLTTTVTRTGPTRTRTTCRTATWRTAAANGECGGDRHHALRQRPSFTSDLSRNDWVSGWGVRPGDWGFGVIVQQQVLPRVSVEVGYNRRWLDNFTSDDNRAMQARPTSRRSPSWRRPIRGCRGGGGQTISGLYNVNPNVVPAPARTTSTNDAYNTLASNYGSQTSLQRRSCST